MYFKSLASSSAGNAYLVESEGAPPLLIDPGIPFAALSRALKHESSRLAGCLISHQHGDHAVAAPGLAQRGVPIYTSRECAEALGIEAFHVEHALPFPIGGWTITPWDAVHDVKCHGFVIDAPDGDRLMYCTDSAYVPYRFGELTHIAIGANYSEAILAERVAAGQMDKAHGERVLTCHMSIERVVAFLRANDLSRLREVHLLHLSAGNSNEAEFRNAVQRASGVPVYVAGV